MDEIDEKDEQIDQILPSDLDLRLINDQNTPEFGFVLKTFSTALHKMYPWMYIPNNIFFPNQKQILKNILNSGAKLLFANLKDDPDHYFGYVIVNNNNPDTLILYWAHSKSTWRKMGVSSYLFSQFQPENKIIQIPYYTKNYKYITKNNKVIYNPYLLDIK